MKKTFEVVVYPLLALSLHASADSIRDADISNRAAPSGGDVNAPRLAIPVTSYQIDVGDDPENTYSGAPQFDGSFFGNQTRIITKYPSNYLSHREKLGIGYKFYLLESKSFGGSGSSAIDSVILAPPVIPVIQFARIGKINRDKEDDERAIAQDAVSIKAFQNRYPNLIFGGGQTAEVDGDFGWLYKQYYGRLPTGPGGRTFPFAYFDFIESNLKRSGAPYMMQQHNQEWGTHYVAAERAMSLSSAQLFYRNTASITSNLATTRSAARQYPHPFGVQFSGQPDLLVSNARQVLDAGATPVYTVKKNRWGPNYMKSYALSRQTLYLSWLNGARFFNWEGGEFINSVAPGFPSPLGVFTKKASDIISRVGPTGPVQTPIAIISEFSNVWQPPDIKAKGIIDFKITGDAPYAQGDYQLHGLRDFFHPRYLQCEKIYEASMGEDYAISPTPYGASIDFLLGDVRPAALQRYGLLVWGGVPPQSPSVVREKLLQYVNAKQGRLVLFGAAARSMFPDWFENSPPTIVGAGAVVSYAGLSITEPSDFSLEKLHPAPGTRPLSMKVLATVNGQPLIVECMGGLILVLSDYGTNRTESVAPAAARWHDNQPVTEIPHQLLNHVTRLLNDEASKTSLFSVGNRNLHFVTTRPKDGEYLVGIANDKLTSEPFAITSNIGTITSLEEILLDDSKPELKDAAGGAAYSPSGLRASRALPLDYGKSDSSHIEGRDFRLFRIKLVEQGVRTIPSIHYPKRPAGRVLAVEGLAYIRSYLQGMPSFFQWFDGVKVDAREFLSLDDGRLIEQAHWLDRRGVRVVVDGSGIDEPTALLVLTKLALVHSGLKDLIMTSPTSAVRSEAALKGVVLRDPAVVRRASRTGDRFDPAAGINILNLYYKSEEDLFRDFRHFESGTAVAELNGKQTALELYPPLAVTKDVSKDFIDVGTYHHSLKALLPHDGSRFRKFRGVKVDSTYLLSRTNAELAADAAVLKQMGLDAVVDLRSDQMHHDGITFYPHIPNYDSGMLLYTEIVSKMRTLGATDLLVRLQDVGEMKNKPAYIAQRDATWNTFADLAQARNINLHLIISPGLTFSSTTGFSKSNVFVIEGSVGNPSPFKLVGKAGKTGKGSVVIHDNDVFQSSEPSDAVKKTN